MPDNLTPEQRSRTMSRIRRRDTKPELLLRKGLWARGLRGYRLDIRELPGRPDIVWSRRRVAVFVDGAFWHGHPSAFTLGKSGSYWNEKIPNNVRRDRAVDAALTDMGWTVLRLWDFDVRRDLDLCIARIRCVLDR
jgi:DNA mismatch endonuclease, patch repair protein